MGVILNSGVVKNKNIFISADGFCLSTEEGEEKTIDLLC